MALLRRYFGECSSCRRSLKEVVESSRVVALVTETGAALVSTSTKVELWCQGCNVYTEAAGYTCEAA